MDLGHLVARVAELEGENAALKAELGREPWPEKIALAMIVEKQASGDVLGQWIEVLRRAYFPGPHVRMRPLYPVQGRNQVAAQALELPEADWQWLYWQDSDQRPDVGLVTRLRELVEMPELRGEQGGVVCGAYYDRRPPHEVQLFEPQPQKKGLYFLSPLKWIPAVQLAQQCYLENRSAPLLPVGGGGTGAMLIRRDVLERMQDMKGRGHVFQEAPISDEVKAEMGSTGAAWKGEQWSEDIYFCIEVRERLGVQVYADTDLRLSSGHLMEQWIGVGDYVRSHLVMGQAPAPNPAPRIHLPAGYEQQELNRQQRRALLRGR